MRGRRPIDALVLDYGLVLSQSPTAGEVERLAELTGLALEGFRSAYEQHRPAYDLGLDSAAYWSRVAGRALDDDRLRRLREVDAGSWLRLDAPFAEWVAGLQRGGVVTGIVSNLPRDILRRLQATHATWLATFDVTLYSCELGHAKPDPAIFEQLLERLGLPPDRVLFVDDRQINVDAATALGLHGLRYRGLTTLRTQVDESFHWAR